MGKKKATNSTIAKSSDGTVQITFSLPWKDIKRMRDEALAEMAKNITVPGFRKGKAPRAEVLKHASQEEIAEKTLNKLLPKAFGMAVDEHKLKPASYPKFELLKNEDGKDWEVRATTCELPEIKLGTYKKDIEGIARVGKILKPGEEPKELSREEKEQRAIEALLASVSFEVPRVLVEDEVNNRLAALLSRLEKLGLNLDNYLASIKKTGEELRNEYETQARNTLKLEFVLMKIAEEDKIEVKEAEVAELLKASGGKDISEVGEDQKIILRSVLRKRKVLDGLVANFA